MKTPQRALLVVDDDPDIRETLAEVLRDEGRTVTTASDGFDALQKLGQLNRPCLVLLDLMMPRMSGLEFLAHLGTRLDRADFDVVVMSAHDALRRESLQFPNVRATVRKPFDIEELLSFASGEPFAVTSPSEVGVTGPERPEAPRT
jgi:CheY-like chemotaxis protein